MQEIVFPGFKFQKFYGDYAPTHVAFDHWYPPLISNDKLWLITFCAFFPSFISNTSIVSINFNWSKLGCSECRKWHFRASNFKNFLAEYGPTHVTVAILL